jgi:acyl homoserine lactone synthase
MLHVYSLASIDQSGWLLPAVLECRYRNFAERQDYLCYMINDCMEHDEYDTPATVYFAWVDARRQVRGTVRINPTDRPYMLRDKFPEMITYERMPASPSVWEGSRICIDRDLGPALRQRIKSELVLAYYEYGLTHGITAVIGLMQTYIMRRVYVSSGCQPERLGDIREIGRQKCLAAKMAITPKRLVEVRSRLGLFSPVLAGAPDYERRVA